MPDLDEIRARGQKFDDSRVETRATVIILRDTLRLAVRPVEGHEYVRRPGGSDNVPAGRGGFELEEVFFARLGPALAWTHNGIFPARRRDTEAARQVLSRLASLRATRRAWP